MLEAMQNLLEVATRAGIRSIVGVRRENVAARDLKKYFAALKSAIIAADIPSLIDGMQKDHALQAAELRLRNIVRKYQAMLVQVLAIHLQQGMLEGWKMATVMEAAGDTGSPDQTLNPILLAGLIDQAKVKAAGSMTAQAAADWAAKQAALLVKGLDATTMQLLRDAIEKAIEERLGVDGLARLIRQTLDDMSATRARMIARTELNNAFSTATLLKLEALGIEYKQWISYRDCCDECDVNAAAGAIKIDAAFTSGNQAPPAHPNCRCTVAGAKGPDA